MSNSWISIAGETDRALEEELAAKLSTRKASGKPSNEEVEYVSSLTGPLCSGVVGVSREDEERLRRLCKLWEIEFKPFTISSHRKFIGPVIVAAKRLLLRILMPVLKELIAQQQDFNAEVVCSLAAKSENSK